MYSFRESWKLDYPEFILLMYLKDKGKYVPFNPREIEEDLSISSKEVMKYIGDLENKHFLRMETKKNEKGILEDFLSLEDFYRRYMEKVREDLEENHVSNSTIFDMIEQEFGRTLSPIEMEIIKAWLEDGFKEELIEAAIKEATFNGVSNLRYIDKILYEWNKKGIHTKKEVEKRNQYRKKEEDQSIEMFEYNWFEDEIDE